MPAKTTAKTKTIPPKTVEPVNDIPTRPQLDALAVWWKLKAKLPPGKDPSVRAIAKELGISSSAVLARLQLLDAKGLTVRKVVQTPGPRDLTKEGEKWLKMA
jgi:biotin operon repressor